jgi:hypothetical protein
MSVLFTMLTVRTFSLLPEVLLGYLWETHP